MVYAYERRNPFVAQTPREWKSTIPEGHYIVSDLNGRYAANFHPLVGPATFIVDCSYLYHRDDGWCKIAVAVARDAAGRSNVSA